MDLRLGEGEKALLWQEIVRAAEKDAPPAEEEMTMKHKSLQTTLRIVLIAAVLTCIFTVTASATDLLGLRAIQLPEPSAPTAAAATIVPASSETAAPAESEAPVFVSITQPQAVPPGASGAHGKRRARSCRRTPPSSTSAPSAAASSISWRRTTAVSRSASTGKSR